MTLHDVYLTNVLTVLTTGTVWSLFVAYYCILNLDSVPNK